MTGNSYWQESVEFQSIGITEDEVNTVTGVEVSVTSRRQRPGDTPWFTPTTLEGKLGVMVPDGRPRGVYVIWARVADSPETPVLKCGEFIVK